MHYTTADESCFYMLIVFYSLLYLIFKLIELNRKYQFLGLKIVLKVKKSKNFRTVIEFYVKQGKDLPTTNANRKNIYLDIYPHPFTISTWWVFRCGIDLASTNRTLGARWTRTLTWNRRAGTNEVSRCFKTKLWRLIKIG